MAGKATGLGTVLAMTPADLADREMLHQLINDYAAAVDQRDRAQFRSLWVDGGVLVTFRSGSHRPPLGERRAPDDLDAIVDHLERYDRTLHVVSNHRVVIDGDLATGEANCEAHHLTEANDHIMAIRYVDRYRRVAGSWLFAHRAVNVLWTSDVTVTQTPLG